MYMVGEFSKLSKVTAKTLRYYDQIGLFQPREINKETGYRYYSSDQLQHLNRIIELRDYGFTINEIKELKEVENPDLSSQRINDMLQQKRQELRTQMMAIQKKIEQIEDYMSMHTREETHYSVNIKEIPRQKVATLRSHIFDFNEYHDRISEIRQVLIEQRIPIDNNDTRFTIYHDCEYKENDIDVEICQSVNKIGVNTNNIVFKEVEKIDMAACILHEGSVRDLRKSYGYLLEWIERNGYEVTGALRECYIKEGRHAVTYQQKGEGSLIEIQAPVKIKS